MSSETNKSEPRLKLLPKVLNGAVAGLIGVTCVFPIDLVKTRLQNQRKPLYTGMFDCAKKTFSKEGFFGMYRGSGVNLLLITPEKAIKLVGNDVFRHLLKPEGRKLSLPRECAAGGLAGACQIIVTTPMELLKIQLQDSGRLAAVAATQQLQLQQQPKLSATTIAIRLIRENGVLGLYKGLSSTFLRDVTFSIIYFPLFAHLNHIGPRREGSDSAVFYVSFLAGIAAGGVASFSANPFDVVKTRLQTLNHSAGDERFTGIVDCITKTLKNEGPLAFFKGAGCRIMVIAPLFGIAQTVYYFGLAESVLKRAGLQY